VPLLRVAGGGTYVVIAFRIIINTFWQVIEPAFCNIPMLCIKTPGPKLMFYGRNGPQSYFPPILSAHKVWAKWTLTYRFAHNPPGQLMFGESILWAKWTLTYRFAHNPPGQLMFGDSILWAKSTSGIDFAHTRDLPSMGEIDPNPSFRP